VSPGMLLSNKSDKKVAKTIEEVKEIPSNPLPDITTAAEYLRRRYIK
jgi:hypothetical protein